MEGIFSILRENVKGLQIQTKRIQLISQNIANAERLPDENGKVYHRQILVPLDNETEATFEETMHLQLQKSSAGHLVGRPSRELQLGNTGKLPYEVKEIEREKLIYDPTNPRADENGYVRMPDINTVEEMVDLVEASRQYEANITVMQAAKELVKNLLKL